MLLKERRIATQIVHCLLVFVLGEYICAVQQQKIDKRFARGHRQDITIYYSLVN